MTLKNLLDCAWKAFEKNDFAEAKSHYCRVLEEDEGWEESDVLFYCWHERHCYHSLGVYPLPDILWPFLEPTSDERYYYRETLN